MNNTYTRPTFDWNKKYNWENKLILIVEDIIPNYEFIKAAISKTKAKIMWAKNGRLAVEMCRDNDDIDLILMDIKLPELDGYEATRQIKAFRPNIPIIAQTAYVMTNEKGKVLQAGCDDLITKPIQINILLSTVDKYIN